MRTGGYFAGCVIAVYLLCLCVPAGAGILATDDTYGMPLWHGSVEFVSPNEQVAAYVEYSVYAPGQFDNRFSGQDPSEGQRYIYAYQVFNTVDPHPNPPAEDSIKYFSVGLNSPGDQQVADVGYLTGTDISPLASILSPSSSVTWNFYDRNHRTRGVAYSQVSDIMIFSSPFAPTWDNGTVAGGTAADIYSSMPSPTPEPASLTLAALAALVCLSRRAKARYCGGTNVPAMM